VLSYLFALIVTGLIIGALARLAVPGRNPMGIVMTIVLGIVGSLVGGLVGQALGLERTLTFVAAVLAAAVLVYLYSGGGRRHAFLGRRRRWL
jgi:uncharacterized membrane protein YeaQ/YmgE (transglycosylase-associated protein family)